MSKLFLLIISLFVISSALNAQFAEEPFDADFNGFTDPAADWVWDANGSADGVAGTDWRGRSRLRSASEGGAAMFTGPSQAATLQSPAFDVAGVPGLYLTFYHYLRTQGGLAQVRIIGPGDVEYFRTTIVPNLAAGEETSAGKFEIIDISSVLGQPGPFQVEFQVEGALDFWLLDDVAVVEDRPAYPSFPRYVGEELTDFGVPFVTDSLGAVAVPFELVVDFADGTTPAQKLAMLNDLNAARKETCVCDRIELWVLPGGIFFDPVSGEPLGDPGEILERTLGTGSTGTVDNIELNLLSYDELQNEPPVANSPLTAAQVASLSLAPDGAVKIAVLDTGLDLDHPMLAGYVFRNDDPIGDGNDDDNDCYVDNAVGWNFVDGNNNPSDDHSHGSHVSGIIAQNLDDCQNCPFQIIPYKTHSSYGVGTLFATSCAMLQAAINDGADVINASWGFYGGGSGILSAAIDTAGNYGALVIAAAGNDSLNMVADQQHPATFLLENVIGVGSFDQDDTGFSRAAFSNYNPAYVDIFAEGIDILSAVPDNDTATKTGTSMSTPAVSAAAALQICDDGVNPLATKSALFAAADTYPAELSEYVLSGNVLNISTFCDEDTDPEPVLVGNYSICIDKVTGVITVTASSGGLSGDLEVLNGQGEIVFSQPGFSLLADEVLEVDLSAFPNGNYFVVITQGERTFVQRLAKR
jgi:hypothetical protein